MAKKGAGIKSMAEVSIRGMTATGKGYVSKKKTEGEMCGVDEDADSLTSGHNHGATAPPKRSGAKSMSGSMTPKFKDNVTRKI